MAYFSAASRLTSHAEAMFSGPNIAQPDPSPGRAMFVNSTNSSGCDAWARP